MQLDNTINLKLGIIEEGKLKGLKLILEPRKDLKDNEYYVEKGMLNGQHEFSKACLICEKFIPDQGCQNKH